MSRFNSNAEHRVDINNNNNNNNNNNSLLAMAELNNNANSNSNNNNNNNKTSTSTVSSSNSVNSSTQFPHTANRSTSAFDEDDEFDRKIAEDIRKDNTSTNQKVAEVLQNAKKVSIGNPSSNNNNSNTNDNKNNNNSNNNNNPSTASNTNTPPNNPYAQGPIQPTFTAAMSSQGFVINICSWVVGLAILLVGFLFSSFIHVYRRLNFENVSSYPYGFVQLSMGLNFTGIIVIVGLLVTVLLTFDIYTKLAFYLFLHAFIFLLVGKDLFVCLSSLHSFQISFVLQVLSLIFSAILSLLTNGFGKPTPFRFSLLFSLSLPPLTHNELFGE
jgi:hypothetical protein